MTDKAVEALAIAEPLTEREEKEMREDRIFRENLTRAQAANNLYSFACELSGRLRQMDKRAKAANRRVVELEAQLKHTKVSTTDQGWQDISSAPRDADFEVLLNGRAQRAYWSEDGEMVIKHFFDVGESDWGGRPVALDDMPKIGLWRPLPDYLIR